MPRKLEIKHPISPPPKTKRLRRRVMRKANISADVLNLAEDAGWTLFYSFRVMPNTVLAYKSNELYGPIFGNDSVLELLVDEKLFSSKAP